MVVHELRADHLFTHVAHRAHECTPHSYSHYLPEKTTDQSQKQILLVACSAMFGAFCVDEHPAITVKEERQAMFTMNGKYYGVVEMLCIPCVIAIALQVVFLSETYGSKPGAACAVKPPWTRLPSLEKELEECVTRNRRIINPETITVQYFTRSRLFKHLSKAATPRDLRWISKHSPYALSKIASFLIARSKFPETAPSIAAHIIIGWRIGKEPLALLDPFIKYMSELPKRDGAIDYLNLDDIMHQCNNGKHKLTAGILIASLPIDIIDSWYHRCKRSSCHNTFQLLSLSALYLSYKKRNKRPTIAMESQISSCWRKSQLGRFVFLMHRPESHPLYEKVLRRYLEDDSLSENDIIAIFVIKEEYICNHIDLQSLKTNPEHLKKLKRYWSATKSP